MAFSCPGYRFSAHAAGIKASGALDVGLIYSTKVASAAAVFTQNRVRAAPVRYSQKTLRSSGGKIQAVVVNSGNANACTGPLGMKDAQKMGRLTASQLGIKNTHILVASTGVIGVPLPMEKVAAGIEAGAKGMRSTHFEPFAHAILTTDKRAKTAKRTIRIGKKSYTMIGCTKGAGMIAPNMATTLSFVVSDAPVSPKALDASLSAGVAMSFNAITVDGDTSTNDMVLLMANGEGPSLRGRDLAKFNDAVRDLLTDLAEQLMSDGEGVHHVAKIRVVGAKTVASARRIARTIANSPLVKTAIAGRDPNWGRILCAVGNAGIPIKPDRLALRIGHVDVVKCGVGILDSAGEKKVTEVMAQGQYEMVIDLGLGTSAAHYLACDLSHGYVTINADYRT